MKLFCFLWAQVPASTTRDWGDVLEAVLKDPLMFMQKNFVWVFIILILALLLFRLNNNLEVRGVNQAILISRGMVNTVIWFVVVPVVIILLFNIIGLMYNLPRIDLWNIWRWIQLLGSTIWWLGKCLFGGAPLMEDLYDGNSITRLTLILVPLSLVWLRTARTGFGRLALVPFIFSIMFITKNKVAPDTFLTSVLKDKYPSYFYSGRTLSPTTKEVLTLGTDTLAVDSLGRKKNLTKEVGNDVTKFYKKNSHQVGLFLGFMVLMALLVGYLFQKPKLGALIAILAIFLYFMIGKSADKAWLVKGESTADRHAELDKLISDFMFTYQAQEGKSNTQLSKLATEINARMKEDNIPPPDSFCTKYKDFFYDLCTKEVLINEEILDEM
jgi:hypothetical protein